MKKAFTLIELLIVIAIIAILALIAIPNFLEAQMRAKVVRVKSDLRTIATALEAYIVDYNRAPIGFDERMRIGTGVLGFPTVLQFEKYMWSTLTSPVAYMTTMLWDPFTEKGNPTDNNREKSAYYKYDRPIVTAGVAANIEAARRGLQWVVYSYGPSRNGNAPNGYDRVWPQAAAAGVLDSTFGAGTSACYPSAFYDPSNGTISYGHLIRSPMRSN